MRAVAGLTLKVHDRAVHGLTVVGKALGQRLMARAGQAYPPGISRKHVLMVTGMGIVAFPALSTLDRNMQSRILKLLAQSEVAAPAQLCRRQEQKILIFSRMGIMAAQAVTLLHWRMSMHSGELLFRLRVAPIAEPGNRLPEQSGRYRGMTCVAGQTFTCAHRGVNDLLLPHHAFFFIMALITKVRLLSLPPFHRCAVRVMAGYTLPLLQGAMSCLVPGLLLDLLMTLIAALRFLPG